MTQTGDLYANIASEYNGTRAPYSGKLYEHLEEFGFVRGLNVLDVGCGTGLGSEPLAERGIHITGIDPSESMLALAREKMPSGGFVEGRAEELPFRPNEFDAVVCAQSVHRFDQPKALAEMIRVTRPTGRVAIWWRKLVADEAMRLVQAEASAAAGVEPPADIMPGSFLAFYGAPFAERWLRVIPHTITTDPKRWIGYERSRLSAQVALGSKADAYHRSLERLLVEKSEDKPFQVRFTQFLYVGLVG